MHNPKLFDLSGKIAIVTGGTGLFGKPIVTGLAEAGATVVIASRDVDKCKALSDELKSQGYHTEGMQLDLGSPEQIKEFVEEVIKNHSRIDILVNNAAIFSTLKMRPFEEIPLDEWTKVLHVNITGTLLMVKALLPSMRQRKWGRIINVSSAAVTMGRPHYLHYTTSKAAVIGMTRSMARELGVSGITVNALLPGAIDTEISRETVTPAQKQAQIDMRSVPREATPQDLTGVVSFLASEASGFVTGQSLIVDGGLTFL